MIAGGQNKGKGSVYAVRGAGYSKVNGKYKPERHVEEGFGVITTYTKFDESNGGETKFDNRYKIHREEGVWKVSHFYKCPHGTDSPPSLGWASTEDMYKPSPTIRCMQPPTWNPLFLQLALDELVAFGLFEQLDQKIVEISACGSIPTLLLLMLKRLEDGFDLSNPGAIRTIFSQIWCCRNGMMASELCELCSIDGGEASTEWNLLFTAISPFLVARGGRYTFLHNFILQAVQARYCPTTGHRWAVASIQFYYFYPNLRRDAIKEKKERAMEELKDLARFVDAKVGST